MISRAILCQSGVSLPISGWAGQMSIPLLSI